MYCYHCMKKTADGSVGCVYCGRPAALLSPPHHLKPGTVLNNKFLVGDSIGEGGFGITYIGLDLILERKIAIKEFFPSGFANRNNTYSNNVTLNYEKEGAYFRTGVEHFLQEAKSIARFHEEKSIVDVIAFFEENNTAYIVMEYLEGETLSDRINSKGKFDPAEIFRLLLPIMNTLEKMHRENIIHRDITPENIFVLPDGSLKLIDFGSARYYAGLNKKTLSVQFKHGYAPIEQYNKNGNQGPWTDVYGLCATIYKCVTGITPVDSLERIQNDTLKIPSSLGVNISMSLEKVLMYGLVVYPEKRCANMRELEGLTQQALDSRAVDKFKTVYADRTYGDTNMYSNARPENYVNQNGADENSPQKKKRKALIAVILVAALLLVIVVILILLFANNSRKTENDVVETTVQTQEVTEKNTVQDLVTVPNLAGKKLSDAANELGSLGLKLDTKYEESDTVAEGYVIRQTIEAGRKINTGDTVMLVVSSGKKEESLKQSQDSDPSSKSDKSSLETTDVDAIVTQIRSDYYATQTDAGSEKTINGVTYYEKNGEVTKIVCQGNDTGMRYSREYYFKNSKQYFAFIFDGDAENRLYYYNDELIRYIDEKGNTFDYDGSKIDCPFREQALNEAYSLLRAYY